MDFVHEGVEMCPKSIMTWVRSPHCTKNNGICVTWGWEFFNNKKIQTCYWSESLSYQPWQSFFLRHNKEKWLGGTKWKKDWERSTDTHIHQKRCQNGDACESIFHNAQEPFSFVRLNAFPPWTWPWSAAWISKRPTTLNRWHADFCAMKRWAKQQCCVEQGGAFLRKLTFWYFDGPQPIRRCCVLTPKIWILGRKGHHKHLLWGPAFCSLLAPEWVLEIIILIDTCNK